MVVVGKQGSQVFTLQGAEHAYRVLIESMNEGALTLTADKTILYANQCFARMVRCPLELVIGNSFRRFISAEDRAILRPLMKRGDKSGSKIQVLLKAGDGSQMPAQISIRPLAKDGFNRAAIGMVVTDMTEARRNEELLRTLTHRVVQRRAGGVALELRPSPSFCAVLVRSGCWQTNWRRDIERGDGTPRDARPEKTVEHISRNSPSVLESWVWLRSLRDTSTELRTARACPRWPVLTAAPTPSSRFIASSNLEQRRKRLPATHVHLTKQGS